MWSAKKELIKQECYNSELNVDEKVSRGSDLKKYI